MTIRKNVLIAAIATLFATPVYAACTGSGSISYCNDANGNNYTVQRIGNNTYMNGTNSQTGASCPRGSDDVQFQ